MNGMYLSGKPGIVQAMQMPPTFGQPPMPLCHPRSGHVALDHRALAAELGQAAVVGAVLRGEVALLVERGPVAALVHGAAEQLRRPAWSSSSGTGPMPASANTRYMSVSVMLSGCAGQPGMFTIGMPALDFQFHPR